MSAPTGLISAQPVGGGGQLPFWTSLPAHINSSTGTLTANAVYLVRFRVFAPTTFPSFSLYVASASGNIDGGIYTRSGTTYTRQNATGSTLASGSNAVQTIAFTTPLLAVPGVDYFAALGIDNGTATVARVSVNTNASFGDYSLVKTGAWSSGLPASISSPAGSTVTPWLGLS